jgi:uncharacterized membrane protein (DUF106 family)
MQKKKQKRMSVLMKILIIIISLWLCYEYLKCNIQHYSRKLKLDKIFNNTYNVGVKLCRQLIEAKSED